MGAAIDFFHLPHFWLVIICLLFASASVIVFYYRKERVALCFLLLSAFFLRLFAALLDPFLHSWDERFHALVARNMISHPFTPLLRTNPVVDYDRFVWCCNSIWLHKQPLFMWQMALSMRLFGISEYSIRYPSVLMGSIMVLFVYRICFLATKQRMAAIIAALAMVFSNYQLELISGYNGMDHNDVAFGFYLLASIWCYAEYIQTKKIAWAVFIGVFVGCAILNKWLTGALVFSGWGLNILINLRDKKTRTEILHFVISIATCIAVFLPWQLYILHAFPEEARFEFAYNNRHLFEVIEGHDGSIFFYLNYFGNYFGNPVWVFLIVGLLASMRRGNRNYTGLMLAVNFFLLFSFFSFFAKTKLISYFFAVAPIGFIWIGSGIAYIINTLRLPKLTTLVVLVLICGNILNPMEIAHAHDANDHERQAKIHNTQIYKNLRSILPLKYKVVVNTNSFEDVELMFYNKDITAYPWCPDQHAVESMKLRSIPLAVFKAHNEYGIPPYITSYPDVFIIDQELQE